MKAIRAHLILYARTQKLKLVKLYELKTGMSIGNLESLKSKEKPTRINNIFWNISFT